MNISDISASQLRQAASIKEEMEKLQEELTSILGTATPAAGAADVPKKRTMSAAARALISAAQKKRWAAKRGTTNAGKPKAKRTMSAATKQKMSEFHKARWAKIRAAKATPAVAPKKKFTMSPAAKAAISKAAKARWAKIKAAQPQ